MAEAWLYTMDYMHSRKVLVADRERRIKQRLAIGAKQKCFGVRGYVDIPQQVPPFWEKADALVDHEGEPRTRVLFDNLGFLIKMFCELDNRVEIAMSSIPHEVIESLDNPCRDARKHDDSMISSILLIDTFDLQ